MQERLAAGNRDHRGAAFVDRLKALLGREVRPQHFGWVLNLAAAAAGEIAAKERLEHEHERIPVIAPQPLHGHVPQHRHHLSNWHTHATRSLARQSAIRGDSFWAAHHLASAMSGK